MTGRHLPPRSTRGTRSALKAGDPGGAFLVLRSPASLYAQGLPPKPCSSWLGSTVGLGPAAPGDAGVSPGNFSLTQGLRPQGTEEILKAGILSQMCCVSTLTPFSLFSSLSVHLDSRSMNTPALRAPGPSPQCLHSPHPPFPQKGLALYSLMPLDLLSHPCELLPPQLPPVLRRSRTHGVDPRLRTSGSPNGSLWLAFNV